jgi:hypothetical protein
MPLKKDLSDLPAAEKDPGWRPDENPRLAGTLADAWWEQAQNHHRNQAFETPFRASSVGYCGRSLYYQARGVTESNPASRADVWRMDIGTLVHEALGPATVEAFPDAVLEVPYLHPSGLVSGHADVVLPDAVVEVKTINGFGFKFQATTFRGAPSGPRRAHILQAALAADALGKQDVIIVYLSLELVSEDLISTLTNPAYGDLGRFAAQWTISEDVWRPMVEAELARLNTLDIYVRDKARPPREVPLDDGSVWTVVEPKPGSKTQVVLKEKGEVVGTDTTWQCGYCRYRDRCIEEGG